MKIILKKWLILISVLLGGMGLAMALFLYRPTALPQPVKVIIPEVQVNVVQPGNYPVVIAAMGTVRAAQQLALKAQVAGKVEWVSERLVPGQVVLKDQLLLKIEAVQYEQLQVQAQAQYHEAKARYLLEQGRQEAARIQGEVLGKSLPALKPPTDLALRHPQKMQAQAALARAKSELILAQRAVAQTQIRAPFDALILEKSVSYGEVIGVQTPLLTMADTTAFWVEVSLPVEQLRWFSVADLATVHGQGSVRKHAAQILSMPLHLDEKSRLGRIILQIHNPLQGAAAGRLRLGDFVEVQITGQVLKQVFRLPQAQIRANHQVWVVREGVLHRVPVNVLFQTKQWAFIDRGLQAGDAVVTSGLAFPVTGMQVKIQSLVQ